MRRYLWKIAGGDCDLLDRSGKDSQFSFYLIGLLYIIINVIIFVGFASLFIGVFDKNIVASLFGALVIWFLISNIYRLTLISLEPQVLPVAKGSESVVFTHVIRYGTVLAFAFFTSKCFEMVFINIMEGVGVYFEDTSSYMEHMFHANKDHPIVWLITIGIMTLFVAPIYLRHRLNNRTAEYYSLKGRRDIRKVLNEYDMMIGIRDEIFRSHYRGYASLGENKLYKAAPLKYNDPPFNTDEKVQKRNLKSSAEFLEKLFGKAR